MYQQFNQIMRSSKLGADDFQGMDKWVNGASGNSNESEPGSSAAECAGTSASSEVVLDGTSTISNFIETVATIFQVSSALMKDVEELVGSVAKCVTVAHSSFQVLVVFRTIVEMASEMKVAATYGLG